MARSLRDVLVRRWLAFAFAVAALFAAAGLLLLFLLEDALIDAELTTVATSVVEDAGAKLPPGFSVYGVADAPLDIHARLPFAQAGEPFEMRRPDRRHVHVLVATDTGGDPRVVVYDVTDRMFVTRQLGRGLAFAAALTAITLLAARALAGSFVGRVTRQVERAVQHAQASASAADLRKVADEQDVRELAAFLRLHASLWEAQSKAVDDERQTLAYLSHELRTPLQSAQTSLALLADDPGDAAAMARLERAFARLLRASRSTLWLSTEREPDRSLRGALLPLLQQLADELQSIASVADQTIEVRGDADLAFAGPREVAETIFANLLLNAIQHGAPGAIVVAADAGGVEITNPMEEESPSSGFGLGLTIVRRLCERVGWTVDVAGIEGRRARVAVRFDASPRR